MRQKIGFVTDPGPRSCDARFAYWQLFKRGVKKEYFGGEIAVSMAPGALVARCAASFLSPSGVSPAVSKGRTTKQGAGGKQLGHRGSCPSAPELSSPAGPREWDGPTDSKKGGLLASVTYAKAALLSKCSIFHCAMPTEWGHRGEPA